MNERRRTPDFANFRRSVFAGFGIDVDDQHGRAFFAERVRDGPADAVRGACDDANPFRELRHMHQRQFTRVWPATPTFARVMVCRPRFATYIVSPRNAMFVGRESRIAQGSWAKTSTLPRASRRWMSSD